MATFQLQSWTAELCMGSVQLHVTEEGPIAPRHIEAANTKEALAALEQYRLDAVANGSPMAIFISLKRGQRSPPGFANATRRPTYVNVEGDNT